jgi:glutamate racemase
VFRKRDGKQTDVVVLACTHYPLVIDEMKLVAPWEVNYLDPAPAIARRVSDVVADLKLAGLQSGVPEPDTVLLTSARGSASESLAAYGAMGFRRHEFVDLPV